MVISSFKGEYEFLSNFYRTEVYYDGIVYPSAENAYQAAKTTDSYLRVVFTVISPKDAKKRGRRLPLRSDWDNVKTDIMTEIVRDKFANNFMLKASLLSTGNNQLIEENWWGDTFWGVCNGRGENHLGRILMQIRDELRP